MTTATEKTTRTFLIDRSHSEVTFQVRHLVTRVRGRFSDFEGTIEYDPADPTRSAVDVSIQASSIETAESQRDAHLRSADFFAVIVSDDPEIRPAHLPASLRARDRVAAPFAGIHSAVGDSSGEPPPPVTLEALERGHIEAALRTTCGHRAQAARMLGISERNLYRKLREYGIG